MHLSPVFDRLALAAPPQHSPGVKNRVTVTLHQPRINTGVALVTLTKQYIAAQLGQSVGLLKMVAFKALEGAILHFDANKLWAEKEI